MFERYLTDLVTTHFGHVIADLNHEKVRITAWNGGALVLEDVALRTNALDHLWANASAASLATNGTTPPVEIVHGRVGRLEVRIPWKVIRTQFLLASQPQQQQPIEERATTNAAAMDPSMTISVLLTDVNILITPCKKRRFKQENGSAQEQTDKPEEEKGGSTTATDTTTASSESLQQVVPAGRESSPSQTELDVRREMVVQAAMDAELLRRVALSSQLPSSATTTAAAEEAATKTTTTWKSKLKERAKALFSNLSVTVQNIHMRYEDPGTSLGFQWNVDSPNSNNRDILTENDTSQQPRRYRPSFAIGVTLREFSIQTEVNNNNLARFAGVQHKIAAAKQLAVYWDSNVQIMSQHTEKESSLIDDNKSKMEEESYYRQTFALLNNVGLPSTSVSKIQMGSNDGDDDDKGFQSRHSFVLDSFSPSIRFGLAPDVKKDNNSYNTMDVSLPPCRFSLSKSLLEDLGYLRKSLATWRHAQQGFLLSEETLRHLTHIRPKQTSSANPRGWWKYAYAAVLALLRDGSQRNNKDTVVSASLNGSDSPGFGATSATGPLQPPQRQLKGWLGLARALGLRRRYVQLYRVFLESEGLDERQRTHNALLSLERKLLVKELVAFRIASYHDMENCGEIRLEGRWSHMWELISAKALTPKNGGSVDDDDTLSLLTADAPSELLSVDRRSQMFVEMAMALIREQRNLALQKRVLACEKAAPLKELSIKIQRDKERETNSIAWKTSLKCSELSLQVNDSPHSHGWKISTSSRQRGAPVAVVRLSCAFVQEQELYRGGSWEMTNSIGSLVVEDCTATSLDSRTASDASPNGRNSVFPKLVGLKGGEPSAVIPEQSFCLDGIVHHQNIWVKIQRSKWMASGEPGSSTTTKIRVLPLEVVYATAPVESMNHILNAANLEFADDYNRIASRLSAWRASQQKRLLRALAHVKKEIHVDVVVGAPVLLLPEGRHLDSSLLIFDLGKLTFTNESKIKQVRDVDFDDKWRLELTDIQVQCSTVGQYRGLHYDIHGVEGSAEITVQHLIEPFSLNFTILTKILGDSSDVSDGQTSIRVLANLPRLAVNFTSSTVRLSRRLQNQWEYRRKERQPFSFQASRASMSLEPKQNQHSTWRPPPQQAGGGGYARVFEFRFIAPLFSVKFENDLASNGKHSSFPTSTPLFDLALKGIEGHFLSEISSDCVSISFTAKVRTLAAIDLYQGVGRAYSFLLSSVSPDRVSGGLSADARAFDNHLSGTELVIFDYKSNDRHGEVNLYPDYSRPLDVQSSDGVDKLSIQFNDLFVEWNPETLATISAAFCFPKEMLAAEPKFLLDQAAGLRDHRDSLDQLDQIDDEFFDAEEDAFYDAESVVTSDQDSHLHSETPLLSKVLESEGSTVSDVVTCPVTLGFGSEVQSPSSSDMPSSPHSESVATPVNQRSKPFEIVFMLSKLQVNFNKESRHRRLMTAEMEGTSIRYKTMVNGGSRTLFSIGNLTFSDCESANNKTLYREILGLKTDGRALDSELSSLLEMEMITKPRTRLYLSLHGLDDDPASEAERPVSVDFAVGAIHGFDNFLRARFSPMRFVYLQQFWFEVVDYFFVGVIGNEVWGGKTATAGDMTMLEGKSVSADDVSFTRFDVVIQSPVILFPVSSCSTDFIRLESSNISFRNRFTYEDLRPNSLFFRADGGKKQWFNNCAIEISAMTLRSWSGIALNQCDNRPTACLSLCWPIGPSALVNVPKWKVKCGVDALNLVLDRQDFALLQHIVQYNIGDESHHLEEWYALQSLSQEIRKLYANSILVHFGYDKKDATPSTFDVTVMVPVISFALRDGDRQEIGVLRCSHVCWKYDKLMDRVSKQQVTCDLEIISSSIGRAILSFDSEENVKDEENALGRDLTYQSITDPSGNNTKILTCVDACIHVVYPAWKSLAAFFQSLPQPSYLSPDQAIQVGDRWYRIGEQSPKSNAKISEVRLGWIDDYGPFSSDTRESFANPLAFPVYEFRFSLVRPGIRVGPGDSAIVVSIETLDFLHEGKDYLIRRSIDVKGVEVQTRGAGQEKRSSDFSLIRPWSLAAAMHGCNGKCQCSCECHSFHFNADILHARAAFSDMAVALDAGMRLIHDVKSTNETFQTAGYSVNPSRSHDSKGSFAMAEDVPCQPKRRRFQVQWEGFRLVVADDSGRHFVGDQDLVIFFMRNLDFSREEAEVAGPLDVDETTCRQIPREYSMRLRLLGLDVMDCLQSEMSPFRPLLTINPKPLGFSAVPLRFDISGDPTNDEDTQCREQQNSYSETTGKPFRDQNEVEGSGFNPAVEFWSNVKESKSYGVDCRSIEMQYNPSVVVAMQRFFGRLGKEARKKHDDIFHRSYGGRLPKNEGTSLSDQRPQYMVTQASVDVRHISICLNKEHQRRRLLESCVNGVHVEFEWTSNGSCFHGHVGELEAIDPTGKQVGLVGELIRSSKGVEKFVQFRYKTFSRRSFNVDSPSDAAPAWIMSKIGDGGAIDDFLDVSVSAVELVYFRGRTEELLDYLSNGMPGKGMGATSRAAKGFVSDRIRKRSFFNVHVDAPRLMIPQGQATQSGIAIRLGDFSLKSWIADNDDDDGASRMLTVMLAGFSGGIYLSSLFGPRESNVLSKIDVAVDIKMASTSVVMSCRLSDVMVRLSYMDYVTFRRVARDNIGRQIERKRWDNLEKAWANEVEGTVVEHGDPLGFSNDITYSTSARLVRYGQGKTPRPNNMLMRLTLSLESLSILLRRDDVDDPSDDAYDMLMGRGQGFELEVGRREDGDKWLNLSLGKIFAFDLGKMGRIARDSRSDQYYRERMDAPSVLVEGYSPLEKRHQLDAGLEFDSQVVVKIDKEASPYGATQIIVVVSYLSITAIVRPLQDIVQFFTCDRLVSSDITLSALSESGVVSGRTIEKGSECGRTSEKESKCEFVDTQPLVRRKVQMRFVSHYPRLVFAADESDPNSRALVLQGLSIVNACFQQGALAKVELDADEKDPQQSSTLTVNADFQDVSSHMNPDIADIAGLRSEHVDILGSMLSSEQITMQQIEKCGGEAPSDIGLPLLLPLTVGIEFEQTSLSRGPKQRFLAISVNPLSIMLSNEDLQLVRAVTEAWTSNRKATKNPGSSQPYLYDSVFLSERLGLGLRKENGHIVVDNVADSATHNFIRTGDLLYAVNGEVISNAAKITLAEIVSRLAMVARPLTLTFSRSLHKKNTEAQQSFLEDPGLESINLRETMDAKHSHLAQPGPAATSQQKIIDKIDISLSSAVLTLMEKEVPLFRGSVSSSKVGCHLSRLEDKIFSLEVSTVIEIEYYNLRIWGWEPFIEPGVIFISSSFQEIYHGLRELAVEIGDRDGGLWLNITDSLGETMSKLLDWREDNGDDTDVGELPLPEAYACDSAAISTAQKDIASRKAANAAFRFATRQKNDTAKPFVFRNRTGLSVAFVKQSHMDVEEHYPRSHSLLGVGEYSGLQQYEPSEIMVVANDEELKFRVDANSCRSRVEGQAEKVQRVSRFPSLTVALQETNGVNADPFKDLQISHPREILLPLTISKQCSDTFDNTHPARGWATWLVEHVDEKTVATLGSSIRVLSLLSHVIEIGIDAFVDERDVWEPSSVMRIGTARLGNPFCLPLWIAMQDQTWRCSARLAGGYRFTPLCRISSDGSVSLESTSSNCIECLPGPGVIKSAWLAITQQEVGGILTICIDCSVAVRNLLPSNIEWEIDEDSSIDFLVENGPSTGEKNTGKVQSLKSGEQAEILSQGWNSMKFRLRPVQDCEWSAWTTLALPSRSKISNNQNKPKKAIKVEEQEESVYTVYMKDAMNVSLPLGLRISRKLSGVDVTVFAELWCTNCTPLDLIFGCPKQQITEAQNGLDSDDTKSKELSVAEATLKEISSLFESGEAGASLTQMDSGSRDNVYDVVRIPGQVASYVTEECFEYLEVVSSTVRRRWWASENPFSPGESISIIDERTGNWDWLDKFWKVDLTGKTFEGWETSPSLAQFSTTRNFNPHHTYRRRLWRRTRLGPTIGSTVDKVNAYFQPIVLSDQRDREKKGVQFGIQVAVRVGGGRWSLTSMLPRQGTVHGVLRAAKSRWPEALGQTSVAEAAMFELCYSVSPLDGDWGLLARSMLVTSRFLLRNDSTTTIFEVKQTGSGDSTVMQILPGQTAPFHWGDFRLPELVSVRPLVKYQGRCIYKWSGGFDPLTIGPVPLRIRKVRGLATDPLHEKDAGQFLIHSIKMEAEIRPRTGGTGINLSFQEEDSKGEGTLYRIENMSTFPVWICQDDILANPFHHSTDEDQDDFVGPYDSIVFALDVPYRQGKYSHRKAASMAILLRARLALAPLSSRAGIETTKVISLATAGARVRLNPSKLFILDANMRRTLQDIRVVGVINNDGPTRVLTLRLMKNSSLEQDPENLIEKRPPYGGTTQSPSFIKAIIAGAIDAAELRSQKMLLFEDDAVSEAFAPRERIGITKVNEEVVGLDNSKELVVSFRAAFSAFIVSLVDSAPSEIAVATFKNMNAIATWGMQRATDSTIYITVTSVQVDNMVPNAPFPVAVCPFDQPRNIGTEADGTPEDSAPLLVIGLSFAPRHKSGIVCLKSATVAPRNLAIKVDLAFLVRLQKFALDLQDHFHKEDKEPGGTMKVPDINNRIAALNAAAASGVGRQKIYLGGLTILPCNIKLSVAPARALNPAQAVLEGAETAAIHQAVRKGDVLLDRKSAGILGVKVGSRNKTPLAVVRGMLKSFVVDGLLRLDGASLNFAGVSLRNHISTGPQLTTALSAHYMASLRQNLPALLGSMAALGNPLGLVRGLGEGVGDFVLEPVRGFQRSVQEMDASHLVDGVARGTLSLARHTVGGFADSAAMLAETFSKNMTVLTLDRRYAQKRDRGDMLREHNDINVASGLGSGVQKLVNGFLDGVTGVVKAPIRGAEKRGFEGFAKGIGKGLLGLLVKPIIGISDGFTDVMIGVKGTVDGASGHGAQLTQVRPRRALYGQEKSIRPFHFADAAASALMLRTRLAGESYLSHLDMGDRVALVSVKRVVILGRYGEELLVLKLKHIESVEVRSVDQEDGSSGWCIIVLLNTPRQNGSEIEVITCKEKSHADQLCSQLDYGRRMAAIE